MEGQGASPDRVTLAAFAVAVVLGAGNFIGVSFSNKELAPFWGAGLRFGLAAVLFVGFVVVSRLEWPRGRDLTLTLGFGFFNFGLFYALMYWALVRVSAGAAAVVLAIVPLATVLLAGLERLERIHVRSIGGAAIAGGGIVWMVVGPQDVNIPIGALLAMIGAAAAVAQSVILGKKLSGHHPAVTNAVGMVAGALMLLGLSAAYDERWVLPGRTDVALAVGYLVLFGSVGLFVLVLVIVGRWTASATSYMFVLFPVVTMALDAVFFDEAMTVQGISGAVLVMIGVWFGALAPAARRALQRHALHPPDPGPETAAAG